MFIYFYGSIEVSDDSVVAAAYGASNSGLDDCFFAAAFFGAAGAASLVSAVDHRS